MTSRVISIPKEQQQSRVCTSCESPLRFAVVPDVYPHVYCSLCHNIYSETKATAKAKKIWWQHLANREQHEIQSHAPMCECGGLFLFNAHPHCTHCGRALPLPFPEDPKGRLRYSDLAVFNGSKVYLDNGTVATYQLT